MPMWRPRQAGSEPGGRPRWPSLGTGVYVVHEGRAEPGRHGALVCFSGKGPGEVFVGDRKVMGVSQWRGREGALFHTCAYTHWDPRPLVELLNVAGSSPEELVADLAGAAIGLDELQLVDVRPRCPRGGSPDRRSVTGAHPGL